jgi:hypothetical protein
MFAINGMPHSPIIAQHADRTFGGKPPPSPGDYRSQQQLTNKAVSPGDTRRLSIWRGPITSLSRQRGSSTVDKPADSITIRFHRPRLDHPNVEELLHAPLIVPDTRRARANIGESCRAVSSSWFGILIQPSLASISVRSKCHSSIKLRRGTGYVYQDRTRQ